MSREKKAAQVVDLPAPPPAAEVPAPLPRLQEVDRLALELAKSKRLTAVAEAKTAIANNENADLAYKYTVLQLYMKYSLTEADAISEDGTIHKGGALPPAPNQS